MKARCLYIAIAIIFGKLTAVHAQTIQKTIIPFRLSAANNIIVKGVINHSDSVSLMLHTAADAVTITEAGIKKMQSMHFNGLVDSVKSWGGQSGTAAFSKENTLELSGFRADSLTIWTDLNSGYETDGKFGLSLFANKAVFVNFDSQTITLQPDMPASTRGYERFNLINRDGLFYISAVLEFGADTFPNTYLLHSGYGGGILLDDAYCASHPIGKRITVLSEKKLSDAYGNVLVIKNGQASLLSIGRFNVKAIPVGFFEGSIGRQKISVAGMEILKRFNWIISSDRKTIFLRPNKNYRT